MKFTINRKGKSYDFFFHKEDKRNGDGAGGKETTKLMYEVIDNFGSLVAKQSMMIEQSLEIAKVTLERAFVLSGLDLDKISEKDND